METAGKATAQAQIAEFDDTEVFSAAIKRVDLEIVQTGRGMFRASHAWFTTGLCDVQVGSINQPFFVRGASHPRRLAFLVELRKSREWNWFGEPMGNSVGLCAGGSDLLIGAAPGTQWALISSAPDSLAQCAETVYGQRLPLPARGPAIIRPDPLDLAHVRELMVEPLASLKAQKPDRTSLNASMDQALCRVLVQMLLGETSALRRAATVPVQQVFKRVHYYMAGHLEGGVRLDELCQASGVSRQTLLRIFANCVGLDPIRYLTVCRLNQVHKALRRADPAISAVADIARAWGFSHLGTFSRQFTELFGVSPDQVLRATTPFMTPHAATAAPDESSDN